MLLLVAALCIVVGGLKLAQSLIVPVLLAFFIASVSFPITKWLREHKVPRMIAVLLTVLVDFAFLTGVVLIAITLVGDLQSKWDSKYYNLTKQKIEEAYTAFENKIKELGEQGVMKPAPPQEETPPRAVPVEPPETTGSLKKPGSLPAGGFSRMQSSPLLSAEIYISEQASEAGGLPSDW